MSVNSLQVALAYNCICEDAWQGALTNNKTDDTIECGQKIKENSPPSTGAKEADYGLQLCPTKQSDPEPDTSKDE